jgi:hypothetical protein
MTGRHHAAERAQAGSGGTTCPLCGATVTGQFCETCGFRVSARRPFAPLGGPDGSADDAQAGLAEPAAVASSGPPESLFPPVPRPEPPFSAWSRPQPSPPARVLAEPPTAPRVVPPRPVSEPQARDEPPARELPARDEPPTPVQPPAKAPSAVRPEPPVAPPTTPIPSLTSVTWTVLVASDRVYYDKMQAARGLSSGVEFPAHTSERRIRLAGPQMRIGRRSPARDLVPEIDLADRPVDPGISRLHAVLTHAPDGTWSILDPGSANGTLVNGRELAIGEMVTLHEGDRINLGAWTVITVHRA